LQVQTLRKYTKQYEVQGVHPTSSKEDIAKAVTEHWNALVRPAGRLQVAAALRLYAQLLAAVCGLLREDCLCASQPNCPPCVRPACFSLGRRPC